MNEDSTESRHTLRAVAQGPREAVQLLEPNQGHPLLPIFFSLFMIPILSLHLPSSFFLRVLSSSSLAHFLMLGACCSASTKDRLSERTNDRHAGSTAEEPAESLDFVCLGHDVLGVLRKEVFVQEVDKSGIDQETRRNGVEDTDDN